MRQAGWIKPSPLEALKRLQDWIGFQSRWTVSVSNRDRKNLVSHFTVRQGAPPCGRSGTPVIDILVSRAALVSLLPTVPVVHGRSSFPERDDLLPAKKTVLLIKK